jgi:hypothetical protein
VPAAPTPWLAHLRALPEPPELPQPPPVWRRALRARRSPPNPPRRPHAAGGRRAPPPCWTRISRTRPSLEAWRAQSCFRPRALSPARVRGPCLPLHSSLRGRRRQTRADLTRALEAWSFQGLHRVLMSVVLPCWSGWGGTLPPSAVPSGSAWPQTAPASAPVSMTPEIRSARPKARRRSASARHAGSGCTCAPRPGRLRAGSGARLNWSAPCSIATTRSNSEAGARFRQPTHVRTGRASPTVAGSARRTT